MRIILFDLMDTLVVDPYHDLLANFPSGLTPRDFFRHKNQDVFEAFERGEISENEYFRAYYKPDVPEEKLKILPTPASLKKKMYRSVSFLDGIADLLNEIHGRPDLRLGVASNYSMWYREILAKRGEIETWMDYLFFSCEMGVRKPDPAYYELIENSLKKAHPALRGEQIFFTDDRDKNLTAAHQRGWSTHKMEGTPGLSRALQNFLA